MFLRALFNSIPNLFCFNVGKSKKGGKRKDAKKKKDPNAPKRALSAFIFFSLDNRQSVIAANPGIKFTDITREIARLWNAVDDDTKKSYEDRAKKDKERYEQDKAAYEAKQAEGSSSEDEDDDDE